MFRVKTALLVACWIMLAVGCGGENQRADGQDEAKRQQRTQQQVELLTKMAERPPDYEPDCRKQAARALGRLGPAAHSAIPALEKLAADSDPEVKQAAEKALSKITTP